MKITIQKLEPGATYLLAISEDLPAEVFENIRQKLVNEYPEIKFLLVSGAEVIAKRRILTSCTDPVHGYYMAVDADDPQLCEKEHGSEEQAIARLLCKHPERYQIEITSLDQHSFLPKPEAAQDPAPSADSFPLAGEP